MNDTINSVGPGMVEPSQPLSPELKKALTVLDESVKSLGLRVFSLDAEQASRQDVRIYVYQVSTGLHKEAGLAPVESVTKLAEEFIFLSDSQAIDLVSNLSELAQQEKKLSEQMEKVLDLIDRDLLGASRGVLMDALGVLFLCSVDTASIEQAIDAGISAEVLCSLVLSKLESHETRLGRLSEALNLQPLSGGSLSHVQRVMSECVKIEKRIDEYEEKEILQQQYKTLSRIVDLSEVRKQATLDVVLSESGQARIRILLEDEMSFFPSEELEKPSGTFKCCTRIVDYHALSDAASLEPVKRGESLDAHEVWIQQLLYGLGVPNIPEVLGAGTDFIVMERGQYCLADRCRGFVNLYSDDEVQLVALEISKTLVGMESVRVNISTAKMLMPTEKKRLDAMQNQGNLTEEEKEELRQNVEVFAQIVHRDIKPRNIVYNPDDTGKIKEVLLIDFGGAREISELANVGLKSTTPTYTAPEVLLGGLASPASDMYSLGASLFEMRYRGDFCPSRDDWKVVNYIIQADHMTSYSKDRFKTYYLDRKLQVSRREGMDELDELIMAMLQPNPKDRITAAAVIDLLGSKKN